MASLIETGPSRTESLGYYVSSEKAKELKRPSLFSCVPKAGAIQLHNSTQA